MEKSFPNYNIMVSVIIPTYKRSDRLVLAVESVLNQTYSNIEIIVVDDNGDNQYRKETELNLKKFTDNNQIKYVKHKENQGGCIARNTGILSAIGKYVTFLDDDDFYESRKIELQLDFFNKNPDLDACLCGMYRIDEFGNTIESRENFPRGTTLKETILDGNCFTSMLLIKKNVMDDLGGFSDIPRFQDKYFMYKLLKRNYKVGLINQQLLTLVEHTEDRISLASSEKVAKALTILAEFEKDNKTLFNTKEWRFLRYKYFTQKAFNLITSNFNDRVKAVWNIINALRYYQGGAYVFKLLIRALFPNKFLKRIGLINK